MESVEVTIYCTAGGKAIYDLQVKKFFDIGAQTLGLMSEILLHAYNSL